MLEYLHLSVVSAYIQLQRGKNDYCDSVQRGSIESAWSSWARRDRATHDTSTFRAVYT
jgi:hypothetical protein